VTSWACTPKSSSRETSPTGSEPSPLGFLAVEVLLSVFRDPVEDSNVSLTDRRAAPGALPHGYWMPKDAVVQNWRKITDVSIVA
jgi:hypothetical protein